jgi:hypothetical protein
MSVIEAADVLAHFQADRRDVRADGEGSMSTSRPWTFQTLHDRCTEEGNCRLWNGSLNSAGHPTASINGKNTLVRRYVLEHLMDKRLGRTNRAATYCNNPVCCSERCLFVSSPSAVLKRAYVTLMQNPAELHKRRQFSVKAGFAKLNMEKADQIRASQEAPKVLAERFGVSTNSIYEIRRGHSWRRSTANSVFNLGA